MKAIHVYVHSEVDILLVWLVICTVFSVQSKGIFNFSDHGTYCTSLGYKCVVTGDTGSV